MFDNKKKYQKPRLKKFKTAEEKKVKTGESLRQYCFWLLARREFGKEELLGRLKNYALDPEEAERLADEMVEKKYVDDDRMAKCVLRNEISKGCGPRKIQMVLKHKKISSEYLEEDLKDVDWFTKAYELKVRKFGVEIVKDQKEKAKQIRFLQGRGYSLDTIFKVISYKPD